MSFLFRKVEDVTTISKSQSLTSVSIKDCTLRVPNETTTLFLCSVVSNQFSEDDCNVKDITKCENRQYDDDAFITVRSSLVPLIEGLCAQIYFRFEISVVCSHLLLFFFVKEKTC